MAAKRALVCTYGTRGDVEPFLALAVGLKAAGFEVLFATSSRFRTFVQSYAIPFFAMSDESLAAIESPDGKVMLEGGGGPLRRIAAGARLAKRSGRINDGLMRQTWSAAEAFAPDVIVYSAKLFGAPHVAQKLGVPAFLGTLQPMVVATSAFPVLGLPELPLPFYNRLTYALVRSAFAPFRKSVNRFRKDLLGLPPICSTREVLLPQGAGPIGVLHAYSPAVLPRPADWPEEAAVTGYWRLDRQDGFTPPADLAAFLDAGPAPVFVGFGSMTSADPEALGRMAVDALRRAGQRGVVAKGWAGLQVEADETVIAIGPTPYDWLFARMAAVVHHGGAGTTAEGFHAGVPCVVCPFFGDQPGWARLSVARGVGAGPVPRKRLTAERLGAAIGEAVSSERLRANAQDLAQRLSREAGVRAAVEIIGRAC